MNGLSRSLWLIALAFGIAVVAINQASVAQNWPQWRGPNRDSVTEFSVPPTWPDALTLKWTVSVGTGHASPIVVGEKIYLHTRQGEQEIVSCRHVDTGELIWHRDYPAPYTMNPAARGHGKGPKSTPVLHNGLLYTLGISGILSCFDAETGALKWRETFSDEFGNTLPLYGVATSPLIVDDRLIVHVGGHDKGALMAFDMKTGDVEWSWDEDGPGYASPILAEVDGTRQIVTQTQNYCIGVSADTGTLLWRLPFTTAYDQNIVTPIIDEKGLLIFSGIEKGTTGFKVGKRASTWSTEQVWHNPEVSMYMSSPVLSEEALWGLSHRRKGQFFCLDLRTGSTLWTSDGRQGENAAIINAGEVLFLLTNNSELIVIQKSRKRFEPVARYSVADSPTWAHPVILKRQILIKDVSTLKLWDIE